MAKLTINKPEVVVPPTTYSLELTYEEAVFIHATLGIMNRDFSRALGMESDPSWAIYNPLHDALDGDNLFENHEIISGVFKKKYGNQ